ncbi:MAG: hypothetical protein AB7J34_18020 [Limisphaerales bacterium]
MKRTTLRWMFPGLGMLMVLAAGSRAADPVQPVVGTRFSIAAPVFNENLGSRRSPLEAEVAAQMALICAEELSYVDWRPLTNGPSADDPTWVLEGTMFAGGTSSFLPPVSVKFEKIGPEPSVRPLISVPLYRGNDLEQPTQDSRRLRDDLLELVRTVFANSDHLKRIQSQLLVKIPVARTIEPDPTLQRVILPSRWGDLLPGEGSQLRAIYSIRQPDGGLLDVRMDMSPSVAVSERIACAVVLFDHPPLPRQTSWHPSMPDSVQSAIPESVRVFMSQYVKDYSYSPTTMEGLVLQPFEGSGTGGAQ